MELKKVDFSELIYPDLNFKVSVPTGWMPLNKQTDTPGSLFNNLWSSSDPGFLYVNLSLTVYPLGDGSQEAYFLEHKKLYEREASIEIVDSGKLKDYKQGYSFIRIRTMRDPLMCIGVVAFLSFGKYCYILQFVAPEEIFENVRPMMDYFFGNFEEYRSEGYPPPVRPESGTKDALDGWIIAASPMLLGEDSIPALAYVNEEHGFSFIVPVDSRFVTPKGNALWSAIVNLPFKGNDRQATFFIQVLPGQEKTSAIFMDDIESRLLEERGGSREKRVSLMAQYGGIEHLCSVYIHNDTTVTSYVWAHVRPDRSFVLELLIPEGVVAQPEEFALLLCNGFKVYEREYEDAEGDASKPGETDDDSNAEDKRASDAGDE